MGPLLGTHEKWICGILLFTVLFMCSKSSSPVNCMNYERLETEVSSLLTYIGLEIRCQLLLLYYLWLVIIFGSFYLSMWLRITQNRIIVEIIKTDIIKSPENILVPWKITPRNTNNIKLNRLIKRETMEWTVDRPSAVICCCK